jgi:hypothetical protein
MDGHQDGSGATGPGPERRAWWRLTRGETAAFAAIIGAVGLLSGVGQFVGPYAHSGLQALAFSVFVVALGGLVVVALVLSWTRRRRRISLHRTTIAPITLVLLAVGFAGGFVGHSVAGTRPATPSRASGSSSGTGQPDGGISQRDNNGCIQGGTGNTQTCVLLPTPESRGQVTVDLFQAQYAVFTGAPNTLPTPPEYPVSAASDHCAQWHEWMSKDPRFYFVNPRLEVRLEAGAPDLVVLTGARVTTFTRRTVPETTLVKCFYQGGGVGGYTVNVDTTTGITRYMSEVDGTTGTMPPAAIEVSKNDYQGVEVHLLSQKGAVYEGALTVTYRVNGKDGSYTVGTRTEPLRWTYFGDNGDYFGYPPGPQYDWHPIQKRWVTGLDPFNLS